MSNLIRSLESMGAVAAISTLRYPLWGKVIFYVYNSNTNHALVKGFRPTPAIIALIQIFRAFAQCSGALFWFDQIPSGRNMAELPTRGSPVPMDSNIHLSFAILGIIIRWVTEARAKEEYFAFVNNSRS